MSYAFMTFFAYFITHTLGLKSFQVNNRLSIILKVRNCHFSPHQQGSLAKPTGETQPSMRPSLQLHKAAMRDGKESVGGECHKNLSSVWGWW